MNYDSIRLARKNEAQVKIECEPGILKELSEQFTFYVKGYQFSPKFRNKVWDGKIRLLDSRSKTLPYGLVSRVIDYADSQNYPILNDLPLATEFSLIEAKEFIAKINPSKVPNDHQVKPFVDIIRNGRNLLLSPTASGKSLILYLYVRYLIEQDMCGVLIVPSTGLVEQMFSDFEDYAQGTWNVEDNVSKLYSGFDKEPRKKLVISTWQSLCRASDEYLERFDFVAGDEVHLYSAQVLSNVMSKLINAKYRFGVTGSLSDTLTDLMVIEGHFGSVLKYTSTKELIDQKLLTPVRVKALVLKHSADACKHVKKLDDQQEFEFICSSPARNRFLTNLVVSLTGNTLVLFRLVKHGELLYDMISKKLEGTKRKVFFISGKTDTDVREEIRAILEKENDAILIASKGTSATGMNIRRLHNIVQASPNKGRIINLQSIGRILRLEETKEESIVYDIADDLRHGKHDNFTLKHFAQRLKLYAQEQFPVKLYKLNLKGSYMEDEEDYENLPNEIAPNLLIIRLINDDDIIGQVHQVNDESGSHFVIVEPLRIVPRVDPTGNGSLTLHLVQWMFRSLTASQEFEIYPDSIITVAEPSKTVENNYYAVVSKYITDDQHKKTNQEMRQLARIDRQVEANSNPEISKFVLNELAKLSNSSTRH